VKLARLPDHFAQTVSHRTRYEHRGTDVLVLCYHAIEDDWNARFSVTPSALKRHVEFLMCHGYRLTTFSDAIATPIAPRTAAITFDDGFRSVIERAFALLSDLGVVATVFVPTEFIDSGRPPRWGGGLEEWIGTEHESKLLPLSPSELVELADAGWEVGSHTCTHPHLRRLGSADLARELSESRRRCSEFVGRPCVSLAYPYGDVDERVRTAAEKAGYRHACTLPRRFHDATPLAWPRVGIWHGENQRTFALKISPTFRRLRRFRVWELAADARVATRRLREKGRLDR
jgi:peptidoglycan/xylan/chitin deacetylase (PgdA/CDA1 family)